MHAFGRASVRCRTCRHKTLCRTCVVIFNIRTSAQTHPTRGATLTLTPTIWGAQGRPGRSRASTACFGTTWRFCKKHSDGRHISLDQYDPYPAQSFVPSRPAYKYIWGESLLYDFPREGVALLLLFFVFETRARYCVDFFDIFSFGCTTDRSSLL